MLHLLDDSLEAFLRREAALEPGSVQVSFAAPDRDWSGGLTGPTVSLFLWDVRQNVRNASAGAEVVQRNGAYFRQGPIPHVSFSYLVTAWASDIRSEHQLLGAVLRAFLSTTELPADVLAGPLAGIRPLPSFEVARVEPENRADFWSALGGQFKPGIDVTLTAAIDPEVLRAAPLPPTELVVDVADVSEPSRRIRARRVAGRITDPAAAGVRVRSRRGWTTVGPDGTFLVPAEPGDELVIETDPPQHLTVPESGGVAT